MIIKVKETYQNWIGWIYFILMIILLIGLAIYYTYNNPVDFDKATTFIDQKQIKSQVDPSLPLSFEYACKNSDECIEGYSCDPLYGVCKIEPNLKCNQTSDCSVGYYCNDICRDLKLDPPNLLRNDPKIMQPCPCSEGFSCVFKEDNHFCLLNQGKPCLLSDDCVSGRCLNGICENKIINGLPCTQDSECISTNCSKNFCQPKNIITGTVGAFCISNTTTGSEKICNPGLYCEGDGPNARCILPTNGLSGLCSDFIKSPNTLGCYGVDNSNRINLCSKSDIRKGSCVNSYFLTIESDNVSMRPLPNQLPLPTENSVCSPQFVRGTGKTKDFCLATKGMSCIDNSSCASNNCSLSELSIYLFQSATVFGKRISDDSFFSNTSSSDVFGINNVAFKKTNTPLLVRKNSSTNVKIKIFGTIQGITFIKEVNDEGIETFSSVTDTLTETVYYATIGNTTEKINCEIFIYEPLFFNWKKITLVNYNNVDVIFDIGATTLYYGFGGQQSSSYIYYITWSQDRKYCYVKRISVTKNEAEGTYIGEIESLPYVTVINKKDRQLRTFDVLDYNGINSNLWENLQNASDRPSFIFKDNDNVYYYQYDFTKPDDLVLASNKIRDFDKGSINTIKLAYGIGKNSTNQTVVYPLMTFTQKAFTTSSTERNTISFSSNLDPNIKLSLSKYNYNNSKFTFPTALYQNLSTSLRYHVKNYYYTHENPLYADNNNFTIIANTFNAAKPAESPFPNCLWLVSGFKNFAVPGYFYNDTILYTSSRNTFIFTTRQCI